MTRATQGVQRKNFCMEKRRLYVCVRVDCVCARVSPALATLHEYITRYATAAVSVAATKRIHWNIFPKLLLVTRCDHLRDTIGLCASRFVIVCVCVCGARVFSCWWRTKKIKRRRSSFVVRRCHRQRRPRLSMPIRPSQAQ